MASGSQRCKREGCPNRLALHPGRGRHEYCSAKCFAIDRADDNPRYVREHREKWRATLGHDRYKVLTSTERWFYDPDHSQNLNRFFPEESPLITLLRGLFESPPEPQGVEQRCLDQLMCIRSTFVSGQEDQAAMEARFLKAQVSNRDDAFARRVRLGCNRILCATGQSTASDRRGAFLRLRKDYEQLIWDAFATGAAYDAALGLLELCNAERIHVAIGRAGESYLLDLIAMARRSLRFTPKHSPQRRILELQAAICRVRLAMDAGDPEQARRDIERIGDLAEAVGTNRALLEANRERAAYWTYVKTEKARAFSEAAQKGLERIGENLAYPLESKPGFVRQQIQLALVDGNRQEVDPLLGQLLDYWKVRPTAYTHDIVTQQWPSFPLPTSTIPVRVEGVFPYLFAEPGMFSY